MNDDDPLQLSTSNQESHRSNQSVYHSTQGAQSALFAQRAFNTQEWILDFLGYDQTHADQYSIQLDEQLHRAPPPSSNRLDHRYLWRFLNHSCRPNTYLKDKKLFALRSIQKDEELTFNYLANEWEMSTPFECVCSHHPSRRLIRGYRFLSSRERIELAQITPVAPYLLKLSPSS